MSDAATEPAPDFEPDGPSLDDMLATGATYRRLDYWTRLGVLTPANALPGSGQNRRWTNRDLALVNAIVPLTAAGLALGAAVELARRAVDHGEHDAVIPTPYGTVNLTWRVE